MRTSLTSRALAHPRARTVLLATGAAALAAVALSPGALGPSAARAGLAVAALGAAAAIARRRASLRPAAPPLTVLARELLGREAGVALLEIDGRRVLVGFGAEGVRLLSDRGAAAPGGEP